MTDGKCDMCSAPSPRWFYPAQDFQTMGILGSQGSWYACDLCAALIERGDREALANRAVDAIIALNPHLAKERAWCLVTTKQLHAEFWDHRTGPVRAEFSRV